VTPVTTRTLVVAFADWSVVAVGAPADEPVAVVRAKRVVAASPAARAEGVLPGLCRREAQARCPAVTIGDHDPARDARAFEPVAAALEVLTPRIEITEPGRAAFPTRGPSRYFGGDAALAARAAALARGAVPGVTRGMGPGVGVADGPFTAALAARQSATAGGGAGSILVVAPGASPAFLAPLPLATLEHDEPGRRELVDVLGRLGLRTLGDLAALPAADLVARFGTGGAVAHRLAAGLDPRPPTTRPPPPELAVTAELDPPAERVDVVAFTARALADELHRRLTGRGMACTRLLIGAETEHGEVMERLWRHEGTLGPGAIADRARWQLHGWLEGSAQHRPTAGISRLRLAPDEVVAATGRQLGFWGGTTGAPERAVRAMARLAGLLGPEAVTVPEWRGGRGAAEQVGLVPAVAVDLDGERAGVRPGPVSAPWPGRLPEPEPATVHPEPLPVTVLDGGGAAVGVSGRGRVTAAPHQVVVGDARPVRVLAWAGPWPVDERWWDPAGHRRRARFQVVTDDGVARLLAVEAGRWWAEAVYD